MKHKIRQTGPTTPRTCGGKRCYTTKQEAKHVKSEQEIINPELELSIYRCLTCSSYHLTRRKTPTE
ncbi:hypothetical protein EYC58_04410 [Candidatus Saccharibacteria bacterium]|nr:MAG: hypothetical protein EYC58_04410 [Candidatus Saccharibacteria bacterium]